MRRYNIRNIFIKTAAAVIILLLFPACGGFFHKAEIGGYVKDSESDNGINGADIRIYLTLPLTPDAEGYIARTSSNTANGNDGYFSNRVVWENSKPIFGEEGDSGTVYIGITHDDYYGQIIPVIGILSDTPNLIPDTVLESSTFSIEELRLSLVDSSGEKINNVRVVLDLNSTADDEEDYVVRSAVNEGDDGVVIFQDVTWRDPDSTDGVETNTETAVLFIDDVDYRLDFNDIAAADLFSDSAADDLGRDYGIKLSFTADQSRTLDPVTLIPIQFTTQSLTGRVVQSGTSSGKNGVRVVLDLNDDATVDEDYVVVTDTDPDTGAGTYTFNNISWENRSAAGTTDTRNVIIRVIDDSYEDAQLAETLTSGPNTNIEAGQSIQVTHVPRTTFSTTAAGRIIRRVGETDFPVQGIEVSATFDDDYDGGAVTAEAVLYTTTNVNGEYSFLIEWTNASPSTAQEVPAGEDKIDVSFGYDPNDKTVGGTPDFSGTPPKSYTIRSWEDPNYLPDLVDEI